MSGSEFVNMKKSKRRTMVTCREGPSPYGCRQNHEECETCAGHERRSRVSAVCGLTIRAVRPCDTVYVPDMLQHCPTAPAG